MGFRDRFYTPRTAKAIMSWRILLGIGVGALLAVAGIPVGAAIGLGAAAYAVSVGVAMPRPTKKPTIDPFVLSEPWRQLMQDANGSGRKLRATIAGASAGPLRKTLEAIAEQFEYGLSEAWAVAKRGDEIDEAVRRLDPTALRSKLTTLHQRATQSPSSDADAAAKSVQTQLDSADRLKQLSAETADTLRLTQTQLDEVVARAAEVSLGSVDTDSYSKQVDDLVVKLEALHAAVQETSTPRSSP
jgi:hypothetical protein